MNGTLTRKLSRIRLRWETALKQQDLKPLQKKVWRFLKKLKIELSYDPAILLLGTYLDKTLIQRDTCTHMFTATPFTTAKTWIQPKCPSTDGIYTRGIYTKENYPAIKKNEGPFAATCMQLEIILNKVGQKEINKYHMISLICGI